MRHFSCSHGAYNRGAAGASDPEWWLLRRLWQRCCFRTQGWWTWSQKGRCWLAYHQRELSFSHKIILSLSRSLHPWMIKTIGLLQKIYYFTFGSKWVFKKYFNKIKTWGQTLSWGLESVECFLMNGEINNFVFWSWSVCHSFTQCIFIKCLLCTKLRMLWWARSPQSRGPQTGNRAILLPCAQFFDWVLMGQKPDFSPGVRWPKKVSWKK